MSRIGKQPITLPEGVSVNFDGVNIEIKGKNGDLVDKLPDSVVIEKKNNLINIIPKEDTKDARSAWGLARSMVYNMVSGVTEGFSKTLEINGVGYRGSIEKISLLCN